jgi:hypothetical protein
LPERPNYENKIKINVVSGHFAKAEQTDCAALCVVKDQARVVVLWGGKTVPLAFQNPHDAQLLSPIPCRRRHTEQFVDWPKIADRFHVTRPKVVSEIVTDCTAF